MLWLTTFFLSTATGKVVDISQEVLALGSSQLLGSFVGSMAVTTSIGRSAVNAASGVCTPFGGIVTGIVSRFASILYFYHELQSIKNELQCSRY